MRLDFTNEELLGEIIGIFAGDGQYVSDLKRWDRRIKIFFNKSEQSLVDYYSSSFNRFIGKFPTVYPSGSVIIVQVHSKEVNDFILKYVSFKRKKVKTIQLKDKNLLSNSKFVKGFLRGLIDSDGYVRKGRKYTLDPYLKIFFRIFWQD